jgi:hypothetical protein
MGALQDFWRNGVILNRFYVDSQPPGQWIKLTLGRGLGYVFFNAVLWSLAGWAVLRSGKELKRRVAEIATKESIWQARLDVGTALWCAVTLVAVLMSGRVFGHYFIPALPALAVLGARGVLFFHEALRNPATARSSRVVLAVLTLLFLVGFFRCHHRTAVLAYETVTQTRTRWSADWGMTTREQEADAVAQYVRERVQAGEPLYIWGYAHDVFWRTRCRPASRYLTPYYIDGRFPDTEATVSEAGAGFRREAAANLIEDLRSTRPRLILDVEGNFTALPQPELVAFIEKDYHPAGNAGPDASRPFRVFELKAGAQADQQTTKVR